MVSMVLSGKGGRCYAAAGETGAMIEFSDDGFQLMLNGIEFDTIDYVPDDSWPVSMENLWNSYLTRFEGRSPYSSERSLHLSLAETTFLPQTTFPSKTILTQTKTTSYTAPSPF